MHGVSDSEQEGFVQRIAIYLLNSLACQVDGRQKLFLGDLGAIGVSYQALYIFYSKDSDHVIMLFSFSQTMLTLINDRLTRKVFDDVMEVAWSTMWNVTDETAINCERFLDGKGMEFFLGCLRVSINFTETKMLLETFMTIFFLQS